MYIGRFRMRDFGIFQDAQAPELSPGLNIFFGANGAGKTTCVDFLCAMLSGQAGLHELRSSNAARTMEGRVELILPFPEGGDCELVIAESLLSGRELGCNSPEGLARFRSAMSALGGREYKKIFGFGLGEIEHFANESQDAAAKQLYGASFGEGLIAPGQALHKIAGRLKEISGSSSDKNTLLGVMTSLEELREKISNLETLHSSYEKLAHEHRAIQAQLSETRQARKNVASEIRNLERRLLAWQLWSEWKKLRNEEDSLGSLPVNFPAEAVKRLELILASRHSCEQQLAAKKARLDKLVEQKSQLAPDEKIVLASPRLKRLAERKVSFENALKQLDSLKHKKDQLQEELSSGLASLGAGWSCERIRSIDRSLFAREKLEQLAEELSAARQAHQAALAGLTSGNQEVTAAEQALAAASVALANLPDPSAELSAQEREELRANMGRLQECRRQNQARGKNLENARHSLHRALEQAHINPVMANGHIETEETGALIANLLSSRREALEISAELQKLINEKELENERLKMLTDNAENLQKKMDDTLADARTAGASAKNSLDLRARSIHALRSNVSRLEQTRKKLSEIESRLENFPPPAKSYKPFWLVLGLLCVAIGILFFIFSYFWNLTEFSFLETFVIPVSLPLAYGLIVAGVLVSAIGMPRKTGERKRRREEKTRLLASHESSLLEIEELNRENATLASQAGIENADPITLDASEMLLEREKAQRIHEEKNQEQMGKLKEEQEEILSRVRECRNSIQTLESEIQKCRKKWQDLLDQTRFTGSPSPESAATVFTRVETCQIALENVANADSELNALWEDLHQLEATISAMPAVTARLAEAREPLSLEEAVRLVLESCKNADKMWQEKLKAQAALATMENELARARTRQTEAAGRLEEASARLDSARSEWQKHASRFGSEEQAEPQTMREAMRLMDKCLEAEENLESLSRSIGQNETEISDVRGNLASLLDELGRKPVQAGQDSLEVLDALLDYADQNFEIVAEEKRLGSLISSNEEDLEAIKAELATVDRREQTLLEQANAKNTEELLRLAALHARKNELDASLRKLETSLEDYSGKDKLEEFLASFQENEKEAGKSRLEELQTELDKLTDQEQGLAGKAGMLDARIKGLDQPEELGRLRQKEAILTEKLRQKVLDWGGWAMARGLLEKAAPVYEETNQPQIARLASRFLEEATRQAIAGLKINIEKKEIFLKDSNGASVPARHLNRSLLELAYISLRLAFIKDFASTNGSLPLIMDEIMANFDPDSASQFVTLLAKFAKAEGPGSQQILYFTCQPHLLALFRKVDATARVFKIAQGKIEAA